MLWGTYTQSLKYDLFWCSKPSMLEVLYKQIQLNMSDEKAAELGFYI